MVEHKFNIKNKERHFLQYDVGVEANNYYPISSKQILEFYGEEVLKNPYNNHHEKNIEDKNSGKRMDEKIIKEFEEIDKKLRSLRRGKNELIDAILDIYDAIDRKDKLDYEEAIDNLHYFDEQRDIDSELFYLAKRRFLCLNIDV